MVIELLTGVAGRADAVLKTVFSECPTWDRIVPALLSGGVMALPSTCHFVPGVPVKPMLAKATRGAAAACVCVHVACPNCR